MEGMLEWDVCGKAGNFFISGREIYDSPIVLIFPGPFGHE